MSASLIHKMYIAYYQRPADPAGLVYWVDQLETHQDWTVISAAFANAPESQSLYGNMSLGDIVRSIYQSAFNREAAQNEVDFWVDSGFSAADIAFAIVNGAQNEDLVTVNNKLAYSQSFVNVLDPDGDGAGPFTFVFDGDADAARGRDLMAQIDQNSVVTDVMAALDIQANFAQTGSQNLFTVTESVRVTEDVVEGIEPITQTVLLWGDPGNPAGAVSLAELERIIEEFSGYRFGELELLALQPMLEAIAAITEIGIEDALQGPGVIAGNPNDFQIELGAGPTITVNDEGVVTILPNKQGDYTGDYQIVLNIDSADTAAAQVALSQQQFDFMNGLLFDAEGNSRLFQQEITYYPDVALRDGDGNLVLDIDGNQIPQPLREVVTEAGTAFFQPIVLTPTQNNGGTIETGFTSAANNTIVVGRLDLLHQSYIDAGGGYNTLEVDAKGFFAQPLQLLNIQHISVQNLPNVYNYSGVEPGTIGDDFNFGRGDSFLAPDDLTNDQVSILDLSRATSIEKLTVTEGGFDAGGDNAGALILSGIRNAAELNLEGGFSQDLVLNYGRGNTQNGLDIVLNNVDFHNDANFAIAHNANTFNITALGGDNHLNNIGSLNDATLSTINVGGSAHLHISGDLSGIFRDGRLSTVDASENTGGVNMTFGSPGVVGANGQATGFNAMIIMDLSGSMSGQRLQDAQQATKDALDALDSAGQTKVQLVTFESSATSLANWVSVDEAKAAVDAWVASGGTNFAAGLGEAITAWDTSGKIGGGVNLIYAFGDGDVNVSDTSNPSTQEWRDFLVDNQIVANAIGIGTGIPLDLLDVVAYDGVADADLEAVGGDDFAELFEELVAAAVDAVTTPGTGQDRIDFTGSQADDVFTAYNALEVRIENAAGANRYDVDASNLLTIADGSGANLYDLNTGNGGVVNVSAAGNGGNQLALGVSGAAASISLDLAGDRNSAGIDGNSAELNVTTPGIRNRVEVDGDVEVVNADMTGARNSLMIDGDTEEVSAVMGDRGVVSLEGTNETVDVTLQGGNGMVFVEVADDVSISAVGGNNTFDVIAENIDITAGGVNNTALVSGTYDSAFSTGGAQAFTNGALLNIDMSGTLVLGHPAAGRGDGVTALEGSTIGGAAVGITVLADSNLTQAELSGITSVVLNGTLVLDVQQFLDIGPEAFSAYREAFGAQQNLHLIVNEDTDLTGVDLSSLRLFANDGDGFAEAGVVLTFEVAKGATLTLTAEQLHKNVADDGITVTEQDVADDLLGSVMVTNAGPNFDAFDPSQGRDGYENGGSLSSDFNTSVNADIQQSLGGFERPGTTATVQVLTIDTDVDVDAPIGSDFTTNAQTLKIVGDDDLEFVDGAVVNMTTNATAGFTLDFSDLGGNLIGLTLAGIGGGEVVIGTEVITTDGRLIKQILGNDSDTRINVELVGNVGADSQDPLTGGGLVSSGVETYVVTDLGGEDRQFWTSTVTQDVQVLGLQGNYGNGITFGNVDKDVEFLMEAVNDKFNSVSVGELTGVMARTSSDGAILDAVVNVTLAEGVELPEGWAIRVEGVNLVNAETVTVNVDGGDARIESLDVGDASELTFTSADGVRLDVAGDELDGLTSLDASGVLGTMTLVINGTTDLSGLETLEGIDQVVLAENAVLSLTIEQATAIGAENFVYAGPAGGTAVLNLSDLSDQPFSLADYADGIAVNVAIADDAEVTLNPATDLTGFGEVEVGENTTLTMSGEQLVQLVTSGGKLVAETAGEGRVVVTDFSQAHVDALRDWAAANETALDFSGFLSGDLERITLQAAGDLELGSFEDANNVQQVVELDDLAGILRFDMNGDQLTLATYEQAHGLLVNGGDVKFTFVDAGISIDMAGYTNIGEVEVYALLINRNDNIEDLFLNLASSVQGLENVIRVVDTPEGLSLDRAIVLEAGVTTTGDMQFITADLASFGDNVSNVWINLLGGSTIDGSVVLDANFGKGGTFNTLTIVSTGDEANTITGGITADGNAGTDGDATDPAGVNTTAENNLLKVVLNAEADLVIEGAIVFQSLAANATATLTLSGDADVTLKGLDTTDLQIANLVVNTTAYTGTLTITGGSDSLELSDTASLTFVGSGDIVLDTDPGFDGIDGGGDLEVIDASAHTGTLTLGKVKAINADDFSFTSGTGETSMTLIESALSDDDDANWSFDFSNAAANSVFEISENNDWSAGGANTPSLSINLGANTQLLISEDTDWTNLDLTILGNSASNPIVLGEGVELILTAAQASGLHIVAADDVITDPNQAGYDAALVPTVDIIDLSNGATYDFGNIQEEIAGKITLATDDVEVNNATDLGAFSIELEGLGNAFGDGQTIRFNNEDQAAREITVTGPDTDGTNVVWLFDTISGPVETSGYAAEIGRVWFKDELVNGQNVEALFTRLDDAILRVEYSGEFTGQFIAFDRTVEIVAFTDLDQGLIFSDQDGKYFVENLNIDMGGQVNLGDLTISNVVDVNLQGDKTFKLLTITSVQATEEGGRLMPEAWEFGLVPPNNVNTVGDIASGAGHQLLNVVLNTFTGFPGESQGDLVIGTVTFDGAAAGATATLTVNHGGDVTLKGIDTSDVNVTTYVQNTVAHSGVFLVTGGSAAAAVGNTEVMTLNVGGSGEVWFGHVPDGPDYVLNLDGNGVPYAGVAGADLSVLTVSGTSPVNLGVIALIDGTDDGAVPAFTLTGNGIATTTAILGSGNVAGTVVAPTLETGSTWVFNGVTLTITEDVTFEADSNLTLNNVALTIEGEVDLSEVNLTLTGTTTINVPEGETLVLSVSQVNALAADLVGSGTLKIVDDPDGSNVGDDLGALTFVRTVGVDFSELTVNVEPFAVAMNPAGAVDDAGAAAGFQILGTAFADVITLSNEGDTVTGGAGDDTYTAGMGADTFNVDEGEDTIIGLSTDDVVVVSAGATANAGDIDAFVATADTVNDGTANLEGSGGNNVIDVTLAGGANGFNLDGGDGANVLVGSDRGDVINGGNDSQASGEEDVLTGNGGSDTFVFNIDISLPVTLASETDTAGFDQEIWDIGAFALNTAGNTITVTFQNNANTGSFVITNDATIDFTDVDQVGTRIAEQLTARGLSSTYDDVTDQVTVTGNPGQWVEIIGISGIGDVGTFNVDTAEAATSDDADVAQVEIVTIGDGTAGDVTALGEVYTLSVALAGGAAFTAEYTADGTESEAGLALALANELNPLLVAAGTPVTAVAMGNELTLEDQVPDNGGFSVAVSGVGGVVGTGASVLLSVVAPPDLLVAAADLITDFTTGEDSISFGGQLAAGAGGNYVEAPEAADFAAALAAADVAFDGGATYYLTSIVAEAAEAALYGGDVIAEGDTIGLLFFDANGDTNPDGVIALLGVDESLFAASDIAG